MSTASKELGILRVRNTRYPDCVNPDLYRILYKKDIFILAYERIKSKTGNMTKGVTGTTLDGFSEMWIEQTIQELKNWGNFKFSPGRIAKIPKKNGKFRTLSIAPPREKVIQEVIRLILESIYDAPNGSLFKDSSHGFRSKRCCHTALKEIKDKWSGTKWFIEGDISNFFDEIDHHVLIGILKKKIKDDKFISLMWKYLRAGYNEGNSVNKVTNLSGTPQGGILSPLLSNVYLNELDKYLEMLSMEYTKGRARIANKEYDRITRLITKATINDDIQEMVSLKKLRRKVPSVYQYDPNYFRLRYVRYADDWLVGITGSRNMAEEIREKIELFLKNELKLKLNLDKTFISHAKTEGATFLGIEINTNQNRANHLVKKIANGKETKIKLKSDTIMMNVSISKIIKRLSQAGICSTAEGFPIGRNTQLNNEDWEIIQSFNSILLGISNYYSFVNNRYMLQRVEYIIKYSAAKTLARKHKTTMSNIFRKFGKSLTIKYGKIIKDIDGTESQKSISLTDISWKKNSKDFRVSMDLRDNVILELQNVWKIRKTRLGMPCMICGSSDLVEMHHVKHVRKIGKKNIGFAKLMGLLNRKQVPLCKTCHTNVHAGKHDGMSLNDLIQK